MENKNINAYLDIFFLSIILPDYFYGFSDYFMDSQERVIVRECAKWRNADTECYRGRYSRDSYQLVCECHGVGCNRSARSSLRTTVLLYILCQLVLLVLSPT